jgi:hypothetical protein
MKMFLSDLTNSLMVLMSMTWGGAGKALMAYVLAGRVAITSRPAALSIA